MSEKTKYRAEIERVDCVYKYDIYIQAKEPDSDWKRVSRQNRGLYYPSRVGQSDFLLLARIYARYQLRKYKKSLKKPGRSDAKTIFVGG